MEEPLDAIAFLARSENRVQVLRSLAEAPHTREDLRESLPIARTTLARILNEFESRGWISRTGREYSTTPAADAFLARFVPLLETLEGIRNLGEAIDWLPRPVQSVDFRHLRGADVTTSTPENPAEPFDVGLEVLRTGETYRGLTSTAIPRYVDVLGDRLVEKQMDVEGVIESSFLRTLREDPERAEPWYELAEAGATWLYDGRVPINMHIVDDRVLIWLGERGENEIDIHGLLESRDPSVVSWAEELYERYREESEPLESEALPDL